MSDLISGAESVVEHAASPYLFWFKLAGVAIVVLAIGAAGYVARGVVDAPVIAKAQLATAQCSADHEKARADGNAQVVDALTASVGNVTKSLNTLAAKVAARGKAFDQFMMELANAPPSKVCGGSAAELAFRRSMQQPAVAP